MVSQTCATIKIENQTQNKKNRLHLITEQAAASSPVEFIILLRGSSNKEWDFLYGVVNLHARLIICPFASSRATFLS